MQMRKVRMSLDLHWPLYEKVRDRARDEGQTRAAYIRSCVVKVMRETSEIQKLTQK